MTMPGKSRLSIDSVFTPAGTRQARASATDRLLPIEVKASRRVSHSDARHLLTFLDDYPTAPAPVGRNDPCPCGSGKKFKKCCGAGGGWN